MLFILVYMRYFMCNNCSQCYKHKRSLVAHQNSNAEFNQNIVMIQTTV